VLDLEQRTQEVSGAATNLLDEWTRQAMDALGLDGEMVARDLVLDVAREMAHSVARPAAQLTACSGWR
jgi:hypothetical protein